MSKERQDQAELADEDLDSVSGGATIMSPSPVRIMPVGGGKTTIMPITPTRKPTVPVSGPTKGSTSTGGGQTRKPTTGKAPVNARPATTIATTRRTPTANSRSK